MAHEPPRLTLVYDNRSRASDAVSAIIGPKKYGDIIRRRRSLKKQLRDIAGEARAGLLVLEHDADLASLREELAGAGGGAWVYLNSRAAITDPAAAAAFLEKARHNREILACGNQEPLLCAFPSCSAFAEFLAASGAATQGARAVEAPWLTDISDPAAFLAFISAGSETRHFNRLSGEGHFLIKASADKEKIRREHQFYRLLPESMKNWFLMPYDLKETGAEASYSIERLQVPDMALVWIHAGLTPAEFGAFLDEVFDFIASRASRPFQGAAAAADLLYAGKVRERFEGLKKHPDFPRLDKLLAGGTGLSGLGELMERYFAAWAGVPPGPALQVVGHGDLCFSNMLYHKHTGLLKFIDPKGALTEEELWTDPLYDLAKLSHSILGLYDFINNDLFSVGAAGDGRLELRINAGPLTAYQKLFVDRLEAHGFDPRRVRLCEASLFLSMLPLHMDHPRKVLGFALNALHILDELEKNAR
jgi:hypothetical protein